MKLRNVLNFTINLVMYIIMVENSFILEFLLLKILKYCTVLL